MRAFLLMIGLMWGSLAWSADPSQPHPHQGVLAPYTAPPPVELTRRQLHKLENGDPVLVQERSNGEGHGLAVQDVHADPDVILGRILDFGAYPRMVTGIQECDIYRNAGSEISARFLVGEFLIYYEFYVRHTVDYDSRMVTWTLDYDRLSDLDESVGVWKVEPLEDRPGWSRVYYAAQLRIGSGMPEILQKQLSKNGLIRSTEWVKRESEALTGG